MLCVQVSHILHRLFALQQGIEETDEQFLVQFCPEQLFKAEICVGVNVTFL